MSNHFKKKSIGILVFILCSVVSTFTAYSSSIAWEIRPEKSTLSFTAIENGVPIFGSFSSFSGAIRFDPKNLTKSAVRITVDLLSVATAHADIANTLKTVAWFNTAHFPQAVFEAKTFVEKSPNSYEARGTLTLRGKTLPIVLHFFLQDYSAVHAHATGETVLKRSAFDIGGGQWTDPHIIADEVKVNFDIQATPHEDRVIHEF
jgi:polyisoprenoid-binding protein YceI